MKILIALAFTLFTTLSFAGDIYICKERDPKDEYEPYKMVLTQLGNDKVVEGKFYAFKLEIFKGNPGKLIAMESVNVRTEDVMVKISNSARRVSGIIFMDELEASWLKIGNNDYNFDCN